MKLGLMTAAFPGKSLSDVAEWASGNGFQMLELACWPLGKATRRYAGVTTLDVADLGPKEADEARATMSKYGLEISSFGYYPNPLHPDPEHRKVVIDHLMKVIDAAALVMDEPIVGTFVGKDKDKTVEANFDDFKQIWPEIVHYAGDKGVKIAIENCPMIFSNDEWPGGNNLASTPAIWREMYSIIPDENFGLNLDPSHLIWLMIDPYRVIQEFSERIFHVHAKDLEIDRNGLYENGTQSLGMGWQIPRLPGLGEVDWPAFISHLYRFNYDYVISIEHEDRKFEGTEELVKRGFLIARDILKPYLH
ncbi:MAG: sugar phosphate isomerase/epimerase [Chloroflexi bacterium]|jgi:sugar phosphate isomerase/epimerase|nr:sugar phosphate isomerase/epimerase [Chloroflexota bacterium]